LRTVGEYQGLGRRKTTQGIIIGTIDLSLGGDGWAADKSIKTVCDLKGKTIAVEPNLPARLLMQMALKKECNLTIKDTKLTDIAAADAVGVFSDPKVAAVGTYEPVLSQVVATHAGRGAHIVASSKDYNDLILDIIMAHTGELKAHPDKYVKFLRAIYRAVDYFEAKDKAILIARNTSPSPMTTSRRRCRTSAIRRSTRRSSSSDRSTRRGAPMTSSARRWTSIWSSDRRT
jgi:NitT/TauT family transport system substrate-binding protein